MVAEPLQVTSGALEVFIQIFPLPEFWFYGGNFQEPHFFST